MPLLHFSSIRTTIFGGESPPTRINGGVKDVPNKKAKTVSLNPNPDMMSYKMIKHGFWFSEAANTVFCRMPNMEDHRKNHYSWWRLL